MIKLRSLITINEQAPQGPQMGGAPVPLQTPPPAGGASDTEEPIAPEAETDSMPAPEDPGEYDWTKDFRAFEDAKNKAEASAKKKLLDKMNKSLVGKKITVNASRGYGQPKTDHTLDKVKKISVEFWYKEWVIIITDQNDKKYFLTPGVNIKIEGGENIEAPESEAPSEPEGAPTGNVDHEEEQPNSPPAGPEAGTPGATVLPTPELPPTDQTAQPGTVPPAIPGQPPAPQQPTPQDMGVPQMDIPRKKKNKSLAEQAFAVQVVENDLKIFLLEFFRKDIQETVDVVDYIKTVKSIISEGKESQVTRARLEIPVNHMVEPLDVRDLQLAVKESMWSSGNIGQRFSRGSIDVSKVGRVYIMDFIKETGWKS